MVLPQNELSDHYKIISEFVLSCPPIPQLSDKYDWIKLEPKYKWDNNNSSKFKMFLENSSNELEEIKQRLDAGLTKSTGEKIQAIYLMSAEETLCKMKKENFPKHKSKKWFKLGLPKTEMTGSSNWQT